MIGPVRRFAPLLLGAAVALAWPSLASAESPRPAEQRIENVITAASVYLGVPYRLGAEGPDLMDCSGLIYRAFTDAGEGRRMSGARLGVRSYVRWFAARGALVLDKADAVRGDLAIYGAGEHMGIYLGDGRVISAVLSGVTVHALHGVGLPLSGFLRPDWNGKGKVEPLDPSLLLDQGETPVALIPASAWAPTLDPSALGAQPERGGDERVDMRTATSRTFENPNGTFTTELHAQPIYYQAPGSTEWLPIDLRFADGAVVGSSPVIVNAFASDTATGFLTLAAGESTISIARVAGPDAGAQTPLILADGRTVDYFEFYGDVGLRVFALPDGARTFLVFSEKPKVNRFSLRVAADGVSALQELDGSITLVDAAGVAIGRIPRPLLIDSTDVAGAGGGVFSGAASLSVAAQDDGTQLITVEVARGALNEAVYPAFVDFTLVDFPAAAPGADLAFVSSRHADRAFPGAARPEQPSYADAWLGRQPDSRNDNAIYLHFDDPQTVIGDADIEGATLELYPYWGSDRGVPVTVRDVRAAWAPETLSWLTQPPADTELGSVTLTAGQWSSLDLTASVLAHAAGTPGYGLVLAAAHPGPGSWTRLIARDQSEEIAFGPRLVVTWSGLRPTLGVAPDSLPLAPVLAWTNAPVAAEQQRYEIQVSTDDFATIAASSGVARGDSGLVTTWVPPADELEQRKYLARVRTRSAEYGWSEWSEPYAFRFGLPVIPVVRLPALEGVIAPD